MKKSVRILNGYRLVYEPTHPRAMKSKNWIGYVYEHIVLAEKDLKRRLKSTEVIHHLNSDRSDNRRKNLIVLEKSQHGRLHAWLNSGAVRYESPNKNGENSEKAKLIRCVICNTCLNDKQKTTCSYKCLSLHRSRNKPNKEQLQQDINNNMSILAIGRKYGVSDNAVRKWLKSYNMPIPSRAKCTHLEGVETSGEVQPS